MHLNIVLDAFKDLKWFETVAIIFYILSKESCVFI